MSITARKVRMSSKSSGFVGKSDHGQDYIMARFLLRDAVAYIDTLETIERGDLSWPEKQLLRGLKNEVARFSDEAVEDARRGNAEWDQVMDERHWRHTYPPGGER